MLKPELVDNGRAAITRLDDITARVRTELRAGIGRAALRLAVHVQKDKLNGQVLKVKSDRLKRSIRALVDETETGIVGVVSTPVKYAPAHEYGFHGAVSVKGHLRQIKQAFGRSITPRTIEVKPYTRQMNLPERSFLRSALRDFEEQGVILKEIQDALSRAVR